MNYCKATWKLLTQANIKLLESKYKDTTRILQVIIMSKRKDFTLSKYRRFEVDCCIDLRNC